VRLVVTILKVCEFPSGVAEGGMGDEVTGGGVVGMWRLGGKSYSSASRICENLNSRCGFVSYDKSIPVYQLLAVQDKPSLSPIMPFRPALHQVPRYYDL